MKDIEVVEMAPPDMPPPCCEGDRSSRPGSLRRGGAEGRVARTLSMTATMAQLHCCVLTVREELIRDDRARVQQW